MSATIHIYQVFTLKNNNNIIIYGKLLKDQKKETQIRNVSVEFWQNWQQNNFKTFYLFGSLASHLLSLWLLIFTYLCFYCTFTDNMRIFSILYLLNIWTNVSCEMCFFSKALSMFYFSMVMQIQCTAHTILYLSHYVCRRNLFVCYTKM